MLLGGLELFHLVVQLVLQLTDLQLQVLPVCVVITETPFDRLQFLRGSRLPPGGLDTHLQGGDLRRTFLPIHQQTLFLLRGGMAQFLP